MPSELALRTAKKFADKTVEILGGVGVLEVGIVAIALDAELQEVREVLDALSVRYVDGNRNVLCWCVKPNWDSTKPHEEACQRAQRLMAQLRTDGAS